MSAGSFDRLARELAAPMPRRRALRLAAGALIALALPGRRATAATAATGARARAAGCGRGGGGVPCPKDYSECCGPIDSSDPDSNYTCCPPGECWHQRDKAGKYPTTTCCPPAYRGDRCCDPEFEQVVDGKCTRCPDDQVCGKSCCEESEVCANPRTGLCCVKSWKKCEAGLAGVVKCCPPLHTCCFNRTTKTATCCDAKHPCTEGKCKCGKDETRCGDRCCPKGQICSNGKCCPKGKVNCGGSGKCCARFDCCGKTCCDANSICTNGACCPLDRGFGNGKNARCCPPGTVPGPGKTCCPESDPECCSDGEIGVPCHIAKGEFCVRGTCMKL